MSPGRCTSLIALPPSAFSLARVTICPALPPAQYFFNVLSVWARILSVKDTQFYSQPGKLRGAKGSQDKLLDKPL